MKILGKRLADKEFREIFISEFISITGGLVAGTFLLAIVDRLELMPGLFILLPGFLELHGNIYGSLAARLGTLLHTKHLKPTLGHTRLLHINIWATVLLMLVMALLLGVLAYVLNLVIFSHDFPALIAISAIAAILATIIELPLTIATTFWLFRRGYDPDDIMGPYITTMGDVISIVALLVAIVVVP